MSATAIIVVGYLLITLLIGIYGYKLSKKTPDDYFLAGRKIGPIVLFFTLIATNFSAFFFLGFAGASYRIGYAYYGIMGFGTALVALSFYFIGYKAWKLGKKKGFITPPELIYDRFKNNTLKIIFLLVMVIFTIPYLALQPIGAGIILESLSGGLIPQFMGAVILTVIIMGYVFMGGMRTVAWTDVLQGVLMFVLMMTAVFVVADSLGGFTSANEQLFSNNPDLFSRPGLNDTYTPQIWISFMLLWILSVPMFPQMFMRFFIPKTAKSLKVASMLYPLVTMILFLAPVTIGVLGHIPFPGLEGRASDQILPMMLVEFAPVWLSALIMVGALAAFMSTMDSQILALSSMLTRDLYLKFNKKATLKKQVIIGRAFIVLLALFGLAFAYKPPATILQIATQAFTGLAVLFPTVIAALYWEKATATSCIWSILVGEALVLGFFLKLIPSSLTFGFLPVIPIVIVSALIIVVGSLWRK